MTSTPINGMADFSNFMKNPNATQGKSDMSIGTDFAKTMSKVREDLSTGKNERISSETAKSNALKKETEDGPKNIGNQSAVSDKSEQKSNTVVDEVEEQTGSIESRAEIDADEKTETASQITEAAEALLEQVADELDVSIEEIEKVMEELGITLLGLFDENQMSNLVLEVSGAEDMIALVTDEALYQSMTTLMDATENKIVELQDALGLSENDLEAVMAQIEAQVASEETLDPVVQPGAELVSTESKITDSENSVEMFTLQDKQSQEKDLDVTDGKKTDAQRNEKSMEMTSELDASETAVKMSEEKQNQRENGNDENEGNFTNLLNQQLVQDSTSTETVEGATTVTEYTPEPQEIANQIMDYMRTQVKAEITQLEIQLHPASLGTININLQTREGNLTAQFTAQNELVRSVIESQIMQLQSQLEEQGIKVDAVEVAVSNHQFERNFHQEQGQGSGEQPKKRGARRIDLNALSDVPDEDMTEEEQLTADMMARNGNSVDYTV